MNDPVLLFAMAIVLATMLVSLYGVVRALEAWWRGRAYGADLYVQENEEGTK